MRFPVNTLSVALAFAVLAATLSNAVAQRRGGRGTNRLPGDVELEKGPVPLDDFEKNALAVLAGIEANERFRNENIRWLKCP